MFALVTSMPGGTRRPAAIAGSFCLDTCQTRYREPARPGSGRRRLTSRASPGDHELGERPVGAGVAPRQLFRGDGQTQPGEVPQQRADRGLELEPGKMRPQAEMGADAEG